MQQIVTGLAQREATGVIPQTGLLRKTHVALEEERACQAQPMWRISPHPAQMKP